MGWRRFIASILLTVAIVVASMYIRDGLREIADSHRFSRYEILKGRNITRILQHDRMTGDMWHVGIGSEGQRYRNRLPRVPDNRY